MEKIALGIAGLMVALAIIGGGSIWIAHPVVVDGVLLVSRLVIHLLGSAMVLGITWWYIWFLMSED